MQRREFARTLLLGTGAACSFSLPSAFAARSTTVKLPLRAVLAKAEGAVDNPRWRRIEDCGGDVCVASRRVRVAIDALGFPSSFRPLVVDAMFDTREGIKPFRVATFQPGQLSPASKPFSFDVDSAGLAGFRAELCGLTQGEVTIAGSALLSASRPVLAAGRYLLALSDLEDRIEVGAFSVPNQAGIPLVNANGHEPLFAYLSFSVQPLVG